MEDLTEPLIGPFLRIVQSFDDPIPRVFIAIALAGDTMESETLAIKTARLAQLKFDNAIFSQGLAYLDSVTDQGASRESNGAVGYQVSRNGGGAGNGHPALTAAGMMVRQFNGTGVKNHLLLKGAELTQRDPPRWSNKDFYYWYYATQVMHHMEGEPWKKWNDVMREVIPKHQIKTGRDSGSWPPESDRWGAIIRKNGIRIE